MLPPRKPAPRYSLRQILVEALDVLRKLQIDILKVGILCFQISLLFVAILLGLGELNQLGIKTFNLFLGLVQFNSGVL